MIEVCSLNDITRTVMDNELFVKAICPFCGESWNALIPNAVIILKKGCLACNDNDELLGFKCAIYTEKIRR